MYKSIFCRGYFLRAALTFALAGAFSLPGQAYQGKFFVPGNSHLGQVINPFEAAGKRQSAPLQTPQEGLETAL